MSALETTTAAAGDQEPWPRFQTMEEIIEGLKPSNEVMRTFLRIQYNCFTGPEFNALEEAKLFFPPHDAVGSILNLMGAEEDDEATRRDKIARAVSFATARFKDLPITSELTAEVVAVTQKTCLPLLRPSWVLSNVKLTDHGEFSFDIKARYPGAFTGRFDSSKENNANTPKRDPEDEDEGPPLDEAGQLRVREKLKALEGSFPELANGGRLSPEAEAKFLGLLTSDAPYETLPVPPEPEPFVDGLMAKIRERCQHGFPLTENCCMCGRLLPREEAQ